MSDILDIEIRRKIYHLILKNPGLNLARIAEIYNISHQLAGYHVKYLSDKGYITIEEKEGVYRRYYAKGKIGIEDKKLLFILRQETPLKIVLYLLNNPNSRHKEIINNFDIAPSTLSYYLKKLEKKGIISSNTNVGERGYIVLEQDKIIRFLIQYKPDAIYRRIKETWSDDFRI